MVTRNSIQVAAAVIERDHRILIAQRPSQTHLAGYWEFPGGKREGEESFEQCLTREVYEELGVEVTQPRPFMVIHYDYVEKSVELHFYFCSILRGELNPLGCADFRWVALDELSNFSFPPADEPVVAHLKKRAGLHLDHHSVE